MGQALFSVFLLCFHKKASWQVVETAKREGKWSESAEVKTIQPEQGKWPVLRAYTDSWVVANAQCRWWLQQWKNWQGRGKPTWAAEMWPDTAALHG